MVVFKNHDRLPAKKHHKTLAAEFVQLAELLMLRLAENGQRIKVSFNRSDKISPSRLIQRGWEWLPKEEWPTLAMHVSWVRVDRMDQVSWPPWDCPQIDTGFAYYSEVEFRRIFECKQKKVRDAMAEGKFDASLGPLWLLIVCDNRDDITSHIYPTDSSDIEQLREVVAASEFNFQDSPFQQVWLFSRLLGAKYRLFPITTPAR
ncbi:MAG: hypothetical protein U1F76_05330 [Candidatus Competibacteraceae bacterium]